MEKMRKTKSLVVLVIPMMLCLIHDADTGGCVSSRRASSSTSSGVASYHSPPETFSSPDTVTTGRNHPSNTPSTLWSNDDPLDAYQHRKDDGMEGPSSQQMQDQRPEMDDLLYLLTNMAKSAKALPADVVVTDGGKNTQFSDWIIAALESMSKGMSCEETYNTLCSIILRLRQMKDLYHDDVGVLENINDLMDDISAWIENSADMEVFRPLNGRCPVCLEYGYADKKYFPFPCKHYAHESCLLQWANVQRRILL
ncbi:hypothetical protein SeMB42_g05698 [Synchytrium endobioticum]|uniref:RING-type domain-containing protein n=1 Tax=Synchytrium endobioticum TaxID=286115 RepID=A0A507CPZ1_9FUNG|nr:hypothetical protein SeMB42_g05698 [Synchytrium endobioticum]